MKAARLGEMVARSLANIAHGVAHSCRGEWLSTLFAALAGAAEQHVGDFNPQDLANTAWAFATAGQPDEQLFMAFRTAR